MRASKGDESRDYSNKLEARLKAEVGKRLEMAETATGQENRGLDIPAGRTAGEDCPGQSGDRKACQGMLRAGKGWI